MNSSYSGYILWFNEPDSRGIIFTKDSFDPKSLDNMKLKGEISDYIIDDLGVKIFKN